ncbi:Basic leucine zipper 10 [Platanthera guangdongensis]|uniref:Basic leucine zipper 10 n=1 Tax=Platanthera guangdongensis TaxID=2320717 RepID=A0ABR2LVG9_9ASPA
MEKPFPVEEPDLFWAPSPAGIDRSMMNQSPPEWDFEKFLEEVIHYPILDSYPKPLPNHDPKPISTSPVSSFGSSSIRRDGGGAVRGEDEVVEIKKPHHPTAAQFVQSEPRTSADPEEYAAYLKQKLDMYCAAVAKSRGSSIATQGSSLAESRPQLPDPLLVEFETPVKGIGTSVVSSMPLLQNSCVQGRAATSGSSREQSDDDDLDGEAETGENMDPSDAKRFRSFRSSLFALPIGFYVLTTALCSCSRPLLSPHSVLAVLTTVCADCFNRALVFSQSAAVSSQSVA